MTGQRSLRPKLMHSQCVCVCEKDLQMLEWELCCLELKAEVGKQALPNFSNSAGKGIRHKPAFLSNERV